MKGFSTSCCHYYEGKGEPEFTDEELDFIINYDIKYRMGRGDGDEGEGAE